MTTPLPFDESLLASFVIGECSEAQASEIRLAAERSPRVAAAIRDLVSTISSLNDLREFAPQMEVSRAQRERLRELFGQPASLLTRAASVAREVVAALVFDSWREPAAMGFRGAATARVTRFAADSLGVDMQVMPGDRGDSWHLVGQITGCASAVNLSASEEGELRVLEGTSTPDGYFDIQLASGTYTFRFDTGSSVLVVGPLVIGSRPSDPEGNV